MKAFFLFLLLRNPLRNETEWIFSIMYLIQNQTNLISLLGWKAHQSCCISLTLYYKHHLLKAMWNTFSVCLTCSAERAIEAISLALHSVSHRLKARLNILSLGLSWALWCCLRCTHVLHNCVEPHLKGRLITEHRRQDLKYERNRPQMVWTNFLGHDLK